MRDSDDREPMAKAAARVAPWRHEVHQSPGSCRIEVPIPVERRAIRSDSPF